MVEWKGDISPERSGEKAAMLDRLEGLNVPNFFVVTRDEIRELAGNAQSPEEVLNSSMPDELSSKLDNAYEEIGMSSEVRQAGGEAKNLVGGQRESQRVSVRVSGTRRGVFENRLNIGSSDLEDAIKEVAASFYAVETGEENPAIIVQKMVEPGYTGAAITSYLGKYQLLEAVEGLGTSLEKGITRPMLYLLEENQMKEFEVPRKQVTVKRNQMTGEHERQETSLNITFEEEEIVSLFQELENYDVDVKFVYKRGSFYIVDAFSPGNTDPFDSTETGLEGLRASNGEIRGVVGREVMFSEETVPPGEYRNAIVSRNGGYTSTDAQLARQEGKPAIFSFRGELERGQHLSLEAKEVEIETAEKPERERVQELPSESYSSVTASEVLPINTGNGVYLSPPFSGRYAVTDREVAGKNIPRSGYLSTYGEIFSFNGEKAVVDARKLAPEGLEAALKYLEADLKVLLLDRPDPDVIQCAIKSGFEVFASSSPEQLEEMVRKQEKRFIIDRLRELSG